MTARLYSTSEGNVPSNSSTVGDMITVIKAALVTGYNSKPSAGWELVYEPVSTATDFGKRIAVRSKSTNSEQRIFEITDISATEGKIQCFTDWSGTSGIGLLKSAKINKNAWGTDTVIIANDKFVHLVTRAVYHGFGDIDVFDTINEKTVIYNMQNTNSNVDSHAIASTFKQNSQYFVGVNNSEQLYLRAFCNEYLGWGAKTRNGSPPVWDYYIGGDTTTSTSGKRTSVRKAELMKYVSSTTFNELGYVPMLVYTDNPRTMHGVQLTIDMVNKKIVTVIVDGSAAICFAVDV